MVSPVPAGGSRRATIDDVAAQAGVSVATVSRALRQLPNVAQTTRERVVDAARQLDYRADPHASRLAAGRTMTIAVGVPMLGRWYFANVVAAIEAAVSRNFYDVLLFAIATEDARHRMVANWPALSQRVDGLLLVDVALDRDEVAELVARAAPVVTVGFRTEALPSVRIDDQQGAWTATTHLLAAGHERIALVGDQPAGAVGFTVPHARRTGYRKALRDAGRAANRSLELPGGFALADGVRAGRALLDHLDRPTAVFAMGDEMAFGILHAANERGCRVPEDLSVVGFDDHELARVLGLTTIAQPVARVGQQAARLLLDRIVAGNDHVPEHVELTTRLVERTSVAAPRRPVSDP